MAVNKVIVNGSTIIDVSGDTVDANKLLLDYTATKNNGTKVTGNIVYRSEADLTASGSVVTVSSGFYSSQVTKSVTGGRALPAATIYGTNANVTVGTNTLTFSKSIVNAPRITTSGYISAGTEASTSVQLTANISTLGASTYTPTTTAQTIASNQYLTGTQTIEAIPSAYIIPSGVSTITSNGTYSIGEYAEASVSVAFELQNRVVSPEPSDQVIRATDLLAAYFSNSVISVGTQYTYGVQVANTPHYSNKNYRFVGNILSTDGVTLYQSFNFISTFSQGSFTYDSSPYNVCFYYNSSYNLINAFYLTKTDLAAANSVCFDISFYQTFDGLSEVTVKSVGDQWRPDLFWLAYLAGGYAATNDPLMRTMSYRIGLSDTYNDSQSTYITPSFVSLSEIKNAYGSSIVNYSFYISKFRSGACAGMNFYERGYPTFPYITSISEQCVFEFAQVSGFSSFDIGLNLLPNVTNISGSRVFANIGTGASVNLGATFSELTLLQGSSVFAGARIGYFVGSKISLISAAVCGFQSCRSMSLVSCDILSYINGGTSLFAEASYSSGIDYYLPKLSSMSLCSSAFYRNVIKSMVLTSLTEISNCTGLFGYATFIPSQISWFSNLTEIYGSPYMFQEVRKSSNENLEIYFNKLALISGCYAMMSRASVTYVGMPSLTTLVNTTYLFYQCSFLEDVNFPKLSSVSSCGSLFAYCSSLKSIAFPELESVMMNAWFSNCTALSTAIFPKLTSMSGAAGFASCHNLISLFLLASSMCTLGVAVSQMFASTPLYNYSTLAGQWGSIFVPSSLLTSYKNATNWTTISSRIFAYEDYFT